VTHNIVAAAQESNKEMESLCSSKYYQLQIGWKNYIAYIFLYWNIILWSLCC